MRPWSTFKYIYPFDREMLMDLVYYFDCDRRDDFDDQGYFKQRQEHVERWKRSHDVLVAQRNNGSLIIIHDSRSGRVTSETTVRGVRADVYDYCESRGTPAHIEAWLGERGLKVSAQAIKKMLNGFRAKRLMLEEHGWH